MTRLIRAIERWHRRRTTRWNQTHHGKPAVTTRRSPK